MDPAARLQVNIANGATAAGSRIHSKKTISEAGQLMDRSVEDFPDGKLGA